MPYSVNPLEKRGGGDKAVSTRFSGCFFFEFMDIRVVEMSLVKA